MVHNQDRIHLTDYIFWSKYSRLKQMEQIQSKDTKDLPYNEYFREMTCFEGFLRCAKVLKYGFLLS